VSCVSWRVKWANNAHAQPEPPEPTQPPPNLEILPEDENEQENGAVQRTPEDEKTAEVENLIRQEWEITKEMAMKDRKPVPKVKVNRHVAETLKRANLALTNIKQGLDLYITEINNLLYATAWAITDVVVRTPKKRVGLRPKRTWRDKIELEIKKLRTNISIIEELQKGSNVQNAKADKIKKKFGIKNQDDIAKTKESLKQQVRAKAQRLRRYTKRANFFRQNKTFRNNAKKLYRELGKKAINVQKPPSLEEVETFWSKIWENNKAHNDGAHWIQDQAKENQHVPTQEWSDVTTEETTKAIHKTSNWKAAGCDGVANFWIKELTSLHPELANADNKILKNPEQSPEWLTEGVTFLTPKSEDTENPKNYRPITCLPTMYKVLISIITERTYIFLESNNLLPKEQKGCCRRSYGCKDQLLSNKAILEEMRSKRRNLSTTWIDYKKAFDSVPYTWIIKSLELYKICPTITRFIRENMKKWRTILHLNHYKGMMTSRPIEIKSGIYQGDSLSPLVFSLALAPLSSLLNKSGYGYNTPHGRISYFFYMDDLKTYAKNDDEQTGLLRTIKSFSDDIGKEFGLDKCAKATFKRGRLADSSNIELDVNTVIIILFIFL